MEFVNSHLIAFIIIVSLNPIKMEECNSMTSSSGTYVHFDEIREHFLAYRNMLLNSCRFGRNMGLPDERLCYDHCTLRDNCFAVNVSSDGCQMCYVDELSEDSSTFEPGSSDIYVRRDNLSKQFCAGYHIVVKISSLLIFSNVLSFIFRYTENNALSHMTHKTIQIEKCIR